ncbi:hypothetical protein IC006_0080 [Sulfuracidifex tepidarius]|uniref:Uncharacterized protein n=1 Tax=Sulfuracidifex tepidarius TaxID=1294262 RepID=A0A510DRH9_9CREN|nr:hypothetical protein [Sulfuracidifex tepidarius]BBG22796.1 hypothetical protein IC006_0080 [Sulfuracidifex tepidarius]
MKTKLLVSLIIALFASGLVFSSAAVSSGIIHLNGINSNSATTSSAANNLSQINNNSVIVSHHSHEHGKSNGRKHGVASNHERHVLNLLSMIPNFKFVGYNSSFLKIGKFYAYDLYGKNLALNKTGGDLVLMTNDSVIAFGEIPPLKAQYVIINYSSDMTGPVGVYMKIFNKSTPGTNDMKDSIVIPFYVPSNVTPPNSTFVRYVYANVTINSTSEEIKFAEYVSEDHVFFLPNTTLFGEVKIPLNLFERYSNYTGKYQVGIFVHSKLVGNSTKVSYMRISEWKLVGVTQIHHWKRDHEVAIIRDGCLTFKGKKLNASNSIMFIHGKNLTSRSYNGTAYVTLKSKDVKFSFLVKGNSTIGIRINSNVSVVLLLHSSPNFTNFINVTIHLRYDGKERSLTFHEVKEGNVYYLISAREFYRGTIDVNAVQVLKELGLKVPVDSVSIGTLLPSYGTVMFKLSSSIFS